MRDGGDGQAEEGPGERDAYAIVRFAIDGRLITRIDIASYTTGVVSLLARAG